MEAVLITVAGAGVDGKRAVNDCPFGTRYATPLVRYLEPLRRTVAPVGDLGVVAMER